MGDTGMLGRNRGATGALGEESWGDIGGHREDMILGEFLGGCQRLQGVIGGAGSLAGGAKGYGRRGRGAQGLMGAVGAG